jgi:hypothetical protein
LLRFAVAFGLCGSVVFAAPANAVSGDALRSQARFLDLSTNAKQTFAYHSGSAYIQFDQPELVIGAVRDVYGQRAGAR